MIFAYAYVFSVTGVVLVLGAWVIKGAADPVTIVSLAITCTSFGIQLGLHWARRIAHV